MVRSHMSFRAKRELLAQVAPRYQQAPPTQKSLILDEFVAATGYARKYAIRLLASPVMATLLIRAPISSWMSRVAITAISTTSSACWTTKRGPECASTSPRSRSVCHRLKPSAARLSQSQ